ncbi:HVO_2922 family protein [Haladaptatus sp. NG-WS-4]
MSKATFELFRDARNEWRWRLVHDNGNIIVDSAESYDRKAGAMNGIESVKENAADAAVEEMV